MKMKTSLVTALCVVVQLSCLAAAKSGRTAQLSKSKSVARLWQKPHDGRDYLPDRVIVKLKKGLGLTKSGASLGTASLDLFAKKYSVQSVGPMFPDHSSPTSDDGVGISRMYVMKYTSPTDPFVVARELSQHPDVEYAEPWYIYAVSACTPNDTLRSQQWALNKVLADSAWCISSGDTSVIIGIIDTGVQWDHPDLTPNIWINYGEYGDDGHGGRKESNGIDDDGDGLIDDWHGWDFGGADYNNPVGDNDPRPTDSNNEHGTRTAGVASATTNNHIGVAGMGNKCRILPIKTSSDNDYRASGTAYIVFWLQGLVYAADMGAQIANCSFGGAGGASQAEQEIVNYATSKGTLVVAAAGNSSTKELFYPAAYDNVLSVAATQPSDLLSSYSNYGQTIDVCAPGDAIETTVYPSTYDNLESGTSFASPLTAGVAGLVKALHPSYTPTQVGEQVRISCDDIYAVNSPVYASYLGRGRINAVKALTVISPSIRLNSFVLSDSAGGNNNGIPEPGETLTITGVFTDYLAPTSSSARISLISTNTSVIQVLDSVFTVGSLATLGSANNASAPFRIKVNNTASPSQQVWLRLNYNDGAYSDFQFFQIIVNPLYATHDVNDVRFSVSNFGSLGYYDYAAGIAYGDGFQFPAGSASALFHASLMVGTDAQHVSDNAYGDSTDNAVDFKTAYDGNFQLSKERFADQVYRCVFTDSGVTPPGIPLGVRVTQRSYAYTPAPDNDYVTLRYDIQNKSSTTITNAYVGMYADWDVVDPNLDFLGYDGGRRLGYEWDSLGSNYYGVCLVYPTTAASFRAVNNPTYVYSGFSDRVKFQFLSGGFAVTQGTTADDWSMVLGAGPYTINPGDSVTVGFAFVGGTSLANLQANASSAIAKWPLIMSVSEKKRNGLPASYALGQNYPNPFNPSTAIPFDLPGTSKVVLKVFDVLGREVATLIDGNRSAGSYSVTFDASSLSSGIYFYSLTAADLESGSGHRFTEVKKFMLVK